MLHKMFAEARMDLRVRRPVLSERERADMERAVREESKADKPTPHLKETGSCLDPCDLECPYCSTVYSLDASFCHRCGKRRKDVPEARPGPHISSHRASKVAIDEHAMVAAPVTVGARGQKPAGGSVRRVASLSPELGDVSWQFRTPERRAQSGESAIAKESSLSSSSGKKSLLAYVNCIESKLEELQDENKRLAHQLEVDKANIAYFESQLRAEKPKMMLASSDVAWAVNLELASMALHAWNRAVLRARCERWQLAEEAHAELRIEHAGLLKLQATNAQYTRDADARLAQMESQLAREHRRLEQEEARAFESARESALLQESALQVGQKVTALADQLSVTENRLSEERARLTLEEAEVHRLRMAADASGITHNENRQLLAHALSETETLLAEERLRVGTYETEVREAHCETCAHRAGAAQALAIHKSNSEHFETAVTCVETESCRLRAEIQDLLTAQVEAEQRSAASEIETTNLRASLQIAENENARAKQLETAANRRADEAARQGSELASQLQLLESERCKCEETADVAEVAKGARPRAFLETEGVAELATQDLAAAASALILAPEVVLVDNNGAAKMEEAVAELRSWRLHGTPPKLTGSALQKTLCTRVDELQQQLAAAKAIRACGLRRAGATEAAMAAAAVSAARDAASLERIESLTAELADAQEVNAVVEGLMDDLRSVTKGKLFDDSDSEETRHEGVPVLSEDQTFTSELLETLTTCSAELERARQ